MKIRMTAREGASPPAYATEGSAGMDLRALTDGPVAIAPGARAVIPTGISIELPPGCEAQIRARSGLSMNHGVTLINGVGTIDSDYRGEISVGLVNLGQEPYTVHSGDRIAQMVVSRYEKAELEPAGGLGETGRGSGGFGHTGA